MENLILENYLWAFSDVAIIKAINTILFLINFFIEKLISKKMVCTIHKVSNLGTKLNSQ